MLMNVFDKVPSVNKEAFVAPSASIIGDVYVGRGSSIWYGCVLRGMFFIESIIAAASFLIDFFFVIESSPINSCQIF